MGEHRQDRLYAIEQGEGRQSGGEERQRDAHKLGSAAFNIERGGSSGGLHVGIARRGDVNDGSTAHSGSLVIYNSG